MSIAIFFKLIKNLFQNSMTVFDPHSFRLLAPTALVFFSLCLLFLHLSGFARKMQKKQAERKEMLQAAKRRELKHRECDGNGDQTLS